MPLDPTQLAMEMVLGHTVLEEDRRLGRGLSFKDLGHGHVVLQAWMWDDEIKRWVVWGGVEVGADAVKKLRLLLNDVKVPRARKVG